MIPQRLSRAERLAARDDFRRVYARCRRASDSVLLVYACENDLGHARLGLSVSRKLAGAVGRNRTKRLLREAFRLSKHDLPAVDLVLIPRSSRLPAMPLLQDCLRNLARQAADRLGVARNSGVS